MLNKESFQEVYVTYLFVLADTEHFIVDIKIHYKSDGKGM